MGLLFSASNQSFTEWLKKSVFQSALNFAYKNPFETIVLTGACGAYVFSRLDPEDAAYISEIATNQFNNLYGAAEPYIKPVYHEASKVCLWMSTKLQPVYNALTACVKEIGEEIKPYVQKTELWARKRYYPEVTKLQQMWSNWFAHTNWRGEQVYGDASVLTRLSKDYPIKTYIDMTGLFIQSSAVSTIMPLGKYSFPTSMFLSLYQFGETSSYIPID